MADKKLENLIYTAIRHRPAYYGLHLENGWIGVDTLIYRINFLECDEVLTKAKLNEIAKNNPKFSMNFFHTKIKANEIDPGLDLGLRKSIPPATLYLITKSSIRTGSDKSVLPFEGEEYIKLVDEIPAGSDPKQILVVNSEQMCISGYAFHISNAEDWYVKKIPIRFVSKYVPKF